MPSRRILQIPCLLLCSVLVSPTASARQYSMRCVFDTSRHTFYDKGKMDAATSVHSHVYIATERNGLAHILIGNADEGDFRVGKTPDALRYSLFRDDSVQIFSVLQMANKEGKWPASSLYSSSFKTYTNSAAAVGLCEKGKWQY
ncbi:MAG: hypothetical protein ACR2PT_04515 [Endozoicomonas sp.]